MAAEINPYTRRSGVLAFVLRYGGGLFLVAGLAELVLDPLGQLIELEGAWSIGVPLGFIGLGSLAVLVSGKFDALSAEELLRRDPRPPVLYLRSFEQDRAFATPSGLELQMRFGVSGIGPLVALGRPGDRMPIIGAPRLYARNTDWQEQFREWLEQAALVVIRAGLSEGLDWELGEVGRGVAPQRIVVIPGHSKKVWNEFVDRFPLRLPRQLDDTCLIYFRSFEQPVALKHPRPTQTEKAWYECHEIWTPVQEQIESLADGNEDV
ncbi:MAG: hypothetical protein V3V11_04095 [Vicinamibacteria bacterium]